MTLSGHPRAQLEALLNAVRRRWRTSVVLKVWGRSLLAAGACLAVAVLAARLLSPGDLLLLLLLGVAAMAALGVAATLAWRVGRGPSPRRLARFIEERVSAAGQPLDDVLVSAVEVEGAEGGGFRSLVINTAVRRLQAIGPSSIVTPRELRRSSLEAVAGVAVFASALVIAWPLLSRASEAARLALFPHRIHIQVLPGDARLAVGQPLTIRASVTAGENVLGRVTPGLVVTAGDERRTVPMPSDGNEYRFHFESVDRTFRYQVVAGSSRSQEYTVTALFAPRVERIDLRYQYPAFTDQPPREEPDGGDIYAPSGTKVRFRVHTDKAVETGQLSLGGAAAVTLHRTAERLLEGELVLTRDDSYRVGLTDRDGLRSSDDTEYFIRLMDDRPPDVRILRPAGDQQITPLEEVAIQARADDDYGISRFELVYAVAGRAPKVVPLGGPDERGAARQGSYVLAAEDLKVQPGDVISYYARARDVGRGKRPTETRSDMFFLEVRPFSEEFVSAQSQGIAGMSGDQIESLIAAQKEIINATWNIERRATAGAGRSAADIAAIADAQAELKARAEQIAMQNGRGRSGIPFPQQVGPPRQFRGSRRGADPVGTAISAMGRALDQLHDKRPGDALAHEMAALQGLLQAQAEVRRREVAQQSGAAAGGSGRQGQDLSALFDKELQRQQRTNYQTRSQLEDRQERNGESALDRIRELARRQEELTRRQRELAGRPLAPEERKRQLEELTREQQTLRAEADEMAGQTNSGDMRGASDRMRSAASDLERQDPGSAAERSAQAAEALRRLEQQMRSDSPEGRQRAQGELRMEAQQIANEQRRIASEAGRLERGTGAADADGWRRLAAEKDKLADRVDDLRKSAGQLAAGQKPGEGDQAATTARQLEQQRIAERMREGAKEMARTPGRDAAAREQQIARDLEQAVNRLNAGGERVEDLSEELDRAQALRNRLDSLERQVREAEGKAARARQPMGRSGAGRNDGPAGPDGELQKLREEYARELQRTREALSKLERGTPGTGLGGATPEQHEWSVTDQGTEAFKQDFSQWQALRKDVDSALERYEASVLSRASRANLQDRLNGGGSDRAPDAYRRLIARYYESLARKK